VTAITPATNPSTQSYRNGVLSNPNNVFVTGISASGITMSFVYSRGAPTGMGWGFFCE
jgi:hypothetical protein